MTNEKEAPGETPGQKNKRKTKTRPRNASSKRIREGRPSGIAAYPRHSVRKALRVPRAILDQNAGKACTRFACSGDIDCESSTMNTTSTAPLAG